MFGYFVVPRRRVRAVYLREGPCPIAMDAGRSAEGPEDAPVAVVEYADLECPFSRRNHNDVYELVQRFPHSVRYTCRHFPLPRHANARLLALAVEAAHVQGKGKEMREELFSAQKPSGKALSDSAAWCLLVRETAQRLGLDTAQFVRDWGGAEAKQVVENDYREARALGVRSTPTVYINATPIRGAAGSAVYLPVVEKLLTATQRPASVP